MYTSIYENIRNSSFFLCVCVLNDGDETSQNIKRVTFSLSQSNEMKSIFFYRRDILVNCAFLVRIATSEV